MDDLVTPVVSQLNRQNSAEFDAASHQHKTPEPPFVFDIPSHSYGLDCIVHVTGLFSAYVSRPLLPPPLLLSPSLPPPPIRLTSNLKALWRCVR
jgi:hypothetical protein